MVDEAQDLAPWQWRLLRVAVPSGADDLFLAGDTHQRIYAHWVSLRRVGIDIAGRSARLSVNYRTTAERVCCIRRTRKWRRYWLRKLSGCVDLNPPVTTSTGRRLSGSGFRPR